MLYPFSNGTLQISALVNTLTGDCYSVVWQSGNKMAVTAFDHFAVQAAGIVRVVSVK